MYNKQEMIERIKMILKRRKITQGKMLSDCGMGKNTLARILEKSDREDVNERDILLQNFVKIADYLDCSADFLLGRSNVPEINGRTASFISNISDFDDAVQEQKLEAENYGAAAESTKRILPKTPDLDTIIDIELD